MPRGTRPGPGQGLLFEQPPTTTTAPPEAFAFLPSDYDAPATSLVDYYGTLAKAVRGIARARSNEHGFPKLYERSVPVREYSWRLEVDADETKRIIAKTARRHQHHAQIILNNQNSAECSKFQRFVAATGGFTIKQVQENFPLPPSFTELEYKYFDDETKDHKELEASRQILYERARYYQALTDDET